MEQLSLFEPKPGECPGLAMQHAQRAQKAYAMADVAQAHGWEAIASHYRQQARAEMNEADCLVMLSEFYRLGGVRS